MTAEETADLWDRIKARCARGECAPVAPSRTLAQPCLRWTGNVSNGHGRVTLRVHEAKAFGRREASVHLVVWWLAHGVRAPFVDRLCGDSRCVEPEHLEARTPASNFWRHVNRVSTPDGCWPWTGGTHTFGYGSTAQGSAHRVAYKLAKGEIPPGHVVRHQCHNPICCRPDHLLTGTQKENVQDSVRAGRMNTPRGARAGGAKLTDVQAAALREIHANLTLPENRRMQLLATLVDLTPRNVWRIVTGRGYAEAPPVTTTQADADLPPLDLAAYPVAAWLTWPAARQQAELDRLVAHYRATGFPWEALATRQETAPLDSVRRSQLQITGDTITSVGFAGQRTCANFHLHRYRANYHGQRSVLDAFEDDQRLRRALTYQLKCGDPVTPVRVVRAVTALQRGPLNFPPTLARWLVDTYAPPGGTVLDPCSGYGGRLLGAVASAQHVRYLGADIEPASAAANQRLAAALGVGERVTQVVRAVEDPTPWASADFVLLGPPYYDREHYGAAAAAALAPYPTYAVWRDQFLTQLLEKSLAAAPRVAINVGVIRAGDALYDLPADVAAIVAKLGARVERNLTWNLAKFGTRQRHEQILILAR